MITPTETFALSADTIAQEVGGELILLDLATEQYLALDAVGAEIWRRLSENEPIVRIVDGLVERYGVEQARVESDVVAFLTQLEALGLGQRLPL